VLVPWHLSLGIARIGLLASGKRVVAWQQHSGDDSAAPVSSSVSDDGQSWSSPQSAIDDCGGSEGRNTIDLVASGDAVWLACPKGSSVRVFRATEGGAVPCNPAAPFAGVGVTPSNGSGPAQAFVTQISHCEGASALRIVQLRVTKFVDAQEPAVAPSFEAGLFHLDADSCAPGEAKQLVSTHGTLDCASSTVAQNGNQMIVTFGLAFDTDSFSGERGLFMDSKGGSTTPEPRLGWTEVGSFTVEPEVAGSGGSSGSSPTDRGGVTEDSSGCGCRLARGTGSPAIAVVLGLLAALRRRRQARG
jgi:MYXO-CTERM domain-containing protein